MELYANSLVGVGLASTAYHVSRGKLRKYFRWGDYAMIAACTMCLSRVLKNDHPALMATSAAVLPLQPVLVIAAHMGLMEVTFARRVLADRKLTRTYLAHASSSILGGAFFLADELFPEHPYMHAGWHIAAALGIHTANKLL
eukprot:SM000019S05056  [mRNA]  locus=s19:730505:731210:+ [translate_table: standard]